MGLTIGAQSVDRPGRAIGSTGGRWWNLWAAGIVAAIAVPLAASVVVTARRGGPLVDDFAVTRFQLRHLLTASTSLTGLYSRPGWNHPGPAMFWALEPIWLLTGRSDAGLRVGAPILAAVCVLTAFLLAWRAGRSVLVVVALTTVGSLLALPVWVLMQPWNPWLVLPALILLLTLAIRTSLGRTRDLVGMVVVGSFIVQVHVGSAALVVAALGFALGAVAVDARTAGRAPDGWRATLAWCAGLLTALWIAPIVAVLRGDPGNLSVLARYFVGNRETRVGLNHASGIVAAQFHWLPPWLGGGYRAEVLTGYSVTASVGLLVVPVVVLVLGLLAGAAARRDGARRRPPLRATVLATAWFVLGLGAMAQADEPRAYTIAWIAIVAAFAVVASAWSIAARFRDRVSVNLMPAVATATLVAVLGGCAVLTRAVAVSSGPPLEGTSPALASFRRSLDARPVPGGRRVRIEPRGSTLWSFERGLVDSLDAAGVRVGVPPREARVFNRRLVMGRGDADEVWFVTEQGSVIDRLAAVLGASVRWRTSPLPAADERELVRLQRGAVAAIERAGAPELLDDLDSPFIAFGDSRQRFLDAGVPPAVLDRVGRLNGELIRTGSCRCGIVVVPAELAGRVALAVR